MKSLLLLQEAKEDLAVAVQWYEERQAGLGRRLTASVRDVLARIRENPRAFPVVWRTDTRRAMTKRFPYGVFFVESETKIIVLRIFHLRSNVEGRLSESG